MISKLIFFVITIIIAISCQETLEKKDFPEPIIKNNLEFFYEKALWEVNKWNLLQGENYFNGFTDPKGDTIYNDFAKLPLNF